MTMTTAEKIAKIEESGLQLAWDGCHKIYLVADADEGYDASATGYPLYPAAQIRKVILQSCGLLFVHPWNLGPSELNIDQGTEDIYDAAEAATV